MNEEEKPPVFAKWSYWYGLVIGFLLLQIILFYLFTRYFQ
jgi:hypothetical protein